MTLFHSQVLLGVLIYGTLFFGFLAWNRDDVLFSIFIEVPLIALVLVEFNILRSL